jgi:hypothetical protein
MLTPTDPEPESAEKLFTVMLRTKLAQAIIYQQ